MRTLHLDSGREMRGGQWQVLRLLEGLAQAGIDATLLARAASPLFLQARSHGLDVRPLRFWELLRLSRQADLVHAHDGRSHTLAAVLPHARLLVSRRVAFPIGSGWQYGRATHYIAVSEFVKRVLVSGGVPERKVSVIYDGVPLRAAGSRGDRLVAPATSDPQKGTDLALEAARRAGIALHLSTDLEADLPTAALFVYLTRSEGLGSAVLLAMSLGVTVVASKVGGLSEIIRHGENGVLTENTPEAIAAAIRQLLEDRSLSQRLSACARRTVEEKFSVDCMVRNTITLYRQVLSCY